MIRWPPRERLLLYLLVSAAGLSLAAAAAVILLPLGGGENRLLGGVFPFVVAAAALGALGWWRDLERLLSLLLYAVASIALAYALMIVGYLPLRLTVIGTCPAAPARCPPGFEPQMTGGETLGLEVALVLGILALLLGVAAMELRHRPRLRIIGGSKDRAPQSAPPPEMKPSAIVKRPAAAEPAKEGSGAESRD